METGVKPLTGLRENVAVPWGLAAFLVGLLYGWMVSGKQRKGRLLGQGILVGLLVAAVLAVLGWLTDAPALGFDGGVGVVWTALVLAVLFIVGVWIGDLIEGAMRRSRA